MKYPGVYDYETLAAATLAAKELSDPGTFLENLEENILILQNDLIWKTYEISPFENGSRFSFRDIVVQIALCLAIDKSLIPLAGTKELFNKIITYSISDIDIIALVFVFLSAVNL